MRSRWEALERSIALSIASAEAEADFIHAACRWTILRTFEGPTSVVAFLRDAEDLDEKNVIYRALVEIAQDDGRAAELAQSLLWLGLSRALRRVVQKRCGFFESWAEAAAEVHFRFFRQVRTLDLLRVRRIAATLVRSTDRTVRYFRERARLWDASVEDLPEDDDARAVPAPKEPDPFALSDLRRGLAALVGRDAALVLAVAAYGETQVEAGRRFGLSPACAKKRVYRALGRIRGSGLSTFDGLDAHFSSEGPRTAPERKWK